MTLVIPISTHRPVGILSVGLNLCATLRSSFVGRRLWVTSKHRAAFALRPKVARLADPTILSDRNDWHRSHIIDQPSGSVFSLQYFGSGRRLPAAAHQTYIFAGLISSLSEFDVHLPTEHDRAEPGLGGNTGRVVRKRINDVIGRNGVLYRHGTIGGRGSPKSVHRGRTSPALPADGRSGSQRNVSAERIPSGIGVRGRVRCRGRSLHPVSTASGGVAEFPAVYRGPTSSRSSVASAFGRRSSWGGAGAAG